MKNIRRNYNTSSILAKDYYISNDTWQTGINNNVLVIGPSGAGKTRSYVMPNILQANTSMIVSDCKGILFGELAPLLRKRGFTVKNIDFTSLNGSSGYNPLLHIRYDSKRKKYIEQDILKVCAAIVDIENSKEIFWEQATRMVLASLIGYVLEALPREEHNLESVYTLYTENGMEGVDELMMEHEVVYPESFAVKKYKSYTAMKDANKMTASIMGILSEKLNPLVFDEAISLYKNPNQIDFTELGRHKTAVFLTVSDMDRSLDKLANLFWTQALQELCFSADKDYPEHRLDVPVRLYLDDFASNIRIEDFDKITSNIRSREIYVSIILQSLSQLKALYGEAKSYTIIGNFDQQLVLGIQDMETAKFFANRANRTASTMMNMPLDVSYLFIRGKAVETVKKFDVTTHCNYNQYLKYKNEKQSNCQNDFGSSF